MYFYKGKIKKISQNVEISRQSLQIFTEYTIAHIVEKLKVYVFILLQKDTEFCIHMAHFNLHRYIAQLTVIDQSL
jgi:hypothetical protein